MSTIHTELSVAASEIEPSKSNIYDYSESINDNEEKLDEGLRAPIPIHDDDLDTSLLSDNELEAFVKYQSKHYNGKQSSIPPNLLNIFQRLSGHQKWNSTIYYESQIKNNQQNNKNKINNNSNTLNTLNNLNPNGIHHYKASTFSTLPQIQGSPLQHDISYSEDPAANMTLNQPEQSPFASITPATSAMNMMSDDNPIALGQIDSDTEDNLKNNNNNNRKQTLPFPQSPTSAHIPTSSLQANDSNSVAVITPRLENKDNDSVQSQPNKDKNNKSSKSKTTSTAQPVPECSMRELMKHVSLLTSEVINLQQSLYIKDIMIKNLYLRLKEYDHISFPQLLIERIHIVANINNNKHKYSHKSNFQKPERHKYNKRMTLSEDDSVSHDAYISDQRGYDRIGGPYTHQIAGYKAHHTQNSSNTFVKHHSSVTLEVITRWMPRYNLPNAVKKGLVFLKDDDIGDIDDYLLHQMWSEWQDKMKNKSFSNQGLDKLKREDVHKQLNNYMQHERVGLIRIEILRGKKYKKYKRIEKKFESLIIPIPDIPKGDTYHIMIKVHNPSASIWGPLSNMQSIKVPLKFIDDDDTDNDDAIKTTKSPAKKNKTKK